MFCQAAGTIGSFFTASSVDTWYADLAKPAFNPPSWVFGPVWITLYALMGISLYLIWESRSKPKDIRIASAVFYVQLALNACWSLIFFGLLEPGWAFAEILMLWISIVATIFAFYKIRPVAAYILAPYLAWVSFAAVLNYAIWQLNL